MTAATRATGAATAARRTRAAHLLFAASFLLGGLAVLVPSLSSGATAAPTEGFTGSVTITRTFVSADDVEEQATSRDVTLRVSETANLRGRQEVHVSWEGAVPTGGVVGDPNSSDARNQEYPFVLLQCRGVDTTGVVPRGQERLSPETCWTQTSQERYLPADSSTPAWRFDAHAAAADRAPVVGAPDPLPPECEAASRRLTSRWLPFRAVGGEVYPGGSSPSEGCISEAPESDSAEAGGVPANTTYGITGVDGKGEADFSVWTAAENGSLGCSSEVRCALVAVPIVGLSCDAFGHRLPEGEVQTTKAGVPLSETQLANADAGCRRTGAYQPGETRSSTTTELAVRGQLWWSASNWRNRITVPLGFAETGSVCDTQSSEAPQQVVGSVLFNELAASWRPTFCTTEGLFPFTHVELPDYLARLSVSSGEYAAGLSTRPEPGGFVRPVVQAPAAFGGFAIAFNIDDTERRRRTELKLNARLAAKLLTTSYPANAMVRDNHPSIGGNPLNITLDPEFQALNPGLPVSGNLEAAAALQSFSASSDLMWAFTSWLDADPEARAWLDGYPDPWGMTVNDAYRKVDLPVDNWQPRDDWTAPEFYRNQNPCYGDPGPPFMQLVANPQSNLGIVVTNMQFSTSAVQTACRFDGSDPNTKPLRQQGRQVVGYRFVLGLVSLSAAERYNVRTAALQSHTTVSPGRRFTDATGRTFVAADEKGLTAAAGFLQPDADAGTWALDYAALDTDDGAAAYPGAMPVYLLAATEGLAEPVATKVAKLLCYAAGDGQVPGSANGQLPPGYLPVTADHGLRVQRDYLVASVAAVRAQAGDVPAMGTTAPALDEVCDFSPGAEPPTPGPTDEPSTPGAVATPDVPAAPAAVDPVVAPTGDASVAPTTAPVISDEETEVVLTSAESSGFGAIGVPALLVLALASGLAGSILRWYDALAALATRLRRRAVRSPAGGAA
jgi:hypothetical protein